MNIKYDSSLFSSISIDDDSVWGGGEWVACFGRPIGGVSVSGQNCDKGGVGGQNF